MIGVPQNGWQEPLVCIRNRLLASYSKAFIPPLSNFGNDLLADDLTLIFLKMQTTIATNHKLYGLNDAEQFHKAKPRSE